MTKSVQKPKPNSDITPPKTLGGGLSLRFMRDAWRDLAISRCRTDMFRALTRLDIGVNEVEDYNTSLNLKLRPSILKLKGRQGNRDVVRGAMRYKLRDSVYTTNELVRKRDNHRRQLKKEHGQRTLTTRKILRDLNAEAEDVRKTTREDNIEKIDRL